MMKVDDFEAKKTAIDQKLQWETSNLSRLKESLEKSNNMTKNMQDILETFDSRLRKLEDTITPVYQETGNLQRRQENIDKTLFTLDHVINFYYVAAEVQQTIKEGPSCGVVEYIACLGKLQKAVAYFAEDNPGSPEYSTLTSLFESGRDNLEREFRTLLTRHSTPLPAMTVLNLIGTEEEIPSEQMIAPTSIDYLPHKIVTELAQMATWLVVNGTSNEFMTVYAKTRSTNLMRSLKELKDHMKKASTGSHHNLTLGVTNSPLMSAKMKSMKETPTRRVAKRTSTIVRKSSALIRSSMATFESGVSGTLRRPSALTQDMTKEEVMEYDLEIYLLVISAVLKLIQGENHLLKKIIPTENQATIFDLLIQQALDSIVNEGEQIAIAAKKCITKHEYMSLLSVFPVVKHLLQVKREFFVVLENCQAQTRSRLPSLTTNLNTTGGRALEQFIDNIKNDPDKQSNMPRDGTVHELTNNVIIFLEQLMDYTETAGAMLLAKEPANQVTDQKSKAKLAEYLTKVLSALGLNLNNKADTYNDTTIRSIFMLNNYNYILKSMKRSHMIELVHSWNPDVGTYYDQQLMEQKRLYSRSWSKVLQYIYEAGDTSTASKLSSPESGKLQSKERQLIKDKFSGFNKEMEEIYRVQKTYAIPDQELRKSMTRDNRKYIIPKYKAFLERYSSVNFSRNLEKYLKYTTDDVKKMIEKFFDATA